MAPGIWEAHRVWLNEWYFFLPQTCQRIHSMCKPIFQMESWGSGRWSYLDQGPKKVSGRARDIGVDASVTSSHSFGERMPFYPTHRSDRPRLCGQTGLLTVSSSLTPGRWWRGWWFRLGHGTGGRRWRRYRWSTSAWPTGTACRQTDRTWNLIWLLGRVTQDSLIALVYWYTYHWVTELAQAWPAIRATQEAH